MQTGNDRDAAGKLAVEKDCGSVSWKGWQSARCGLPSTKYCIATTDSETLPFGKVLRTLREVIENCEF